MYLSTVAADPVSKLCSIDRALTFEEITDMIMNTNDEFCISVPPHKPKRGDVFLYKFDEEGAQLGCLNDGFEWRNQGTKIDYKDGVKIKKRYWKRRLGDRVIEFRKAVFEIVPVKRILVHYTRNQDEDFYSSQPARAKRTSLMFKNHKIEDEDI